MTDQTEPEQVVLRPQPGPQESFLSTSADIAIFGGSAGGGKSFALLLEPLRHIQNPTFGCVIFRRYTREILSEGGMWRESHKIYRLLGGIPRENMLDWKFPSGARISFAHMEHPNTRFTYQGAQIALIEFDELTEFNWDMFSFMLSRNRSMSGVNPYIRATCNPDPDSFVADLVSWYIDQETGFAIKEKSGKIRWFVNIGDTIHWGESRKQLIDQYGKTTKPKSFTFIHASIYDNLILLETDPGYLANLQALPYIERQRLLEGNWKVRPAGGNFFKREWFEIVDPNQVPVVRRKIRYWDRAATRPSPENRDPDWTEGLLLSRAQQNKYLYAEDLVSLRDNPGMVERAILNTASRDGIEVKICLEQDPGQAGKAEMARYAQLLFGYNFKACPVSKNKETRAAPASAQALAGNIKVVRGPWNQRFFNQLENFGSGQGHDDVVDVLSGGVNEHAERTINYEILTRM